MNLTSTVRESITIAVLQSLHTLHPLGMTAAELLTPVKLASRRFDLEEKDVNSLLHDMQEQGQVRSEPSRMNKAVMLWKRTDDARALLESMNMLPQ